MTSHGTLYVVATPIGNLGDMSDRARRTLDEVDLIAAEDTRRSAKLLAGAGISTRMVSLHEHNEAERTATLVDALRAGRSIALISDAGTPLISDPGFRLVRAARAAGIAVSPIPGPSAVTAALSVAGLPSDRFVFEGFLPKRVEKRRARLRALVNETRTQLFFLSKHEAADIFADLIGLFGGDRPAVLAREMTKVHETVGGTTLREIAEEWDANEHHQRGELVLVLHGYDGPAVDRDLDQVLGVLRKALSTRQAAALAAEITGVAKRVAYQRALDLNNRSDDGT